MSKIELEKMLDSFHILQQEQIKQLVEEKTQNLQNTIDKATTLYLKELSEKGEVDNLACKMFNVLEGNVK